MTAPPRRTCDEVHALLPERLIGDLTSSGRDMVDAHLATCARCAREWRELQVVGAALTRDPGPSTAEVAQARLALRRALHAAPSARIPARRWQHPAARAAGFLLTIGLLTPLTRLWAPDLERAAPTSVLRPHWESGVQSVRERLAPWLPSWSPTEWFADLRAPSSGLLDGLPALHSGAPWEPRRSG